MTTSPPAVSIRNLSFAWPGGPEVLSIADFRVEAGERVFLAGPSGSGKSTLLGLIAGVIAPQAGEIETLVQPMHAMSAQARDALRGARMGVIFQLFNLLPYLSPVENVLLATRFSAERAKAARASGEGAVAEARRLLSRLGLEGEALGRSSVTLSVGQQQRVAAARALIGSPGLVIADEPTSALDTDSREAFIALLQEEAAKSGAALLFVSHDRALADKFDRVIDLAENNAAGVSA
jgi:putative ABC transport system ATP-binding protein